MKKERLQELAGIQLTESNDEVMYGEYLKDITKNIMNAWDKAKALDIDFETFSYEVGQVTKNALQDLED